MSAVVLTAALLPTIGTTVGTLPAHARSGSPANVPTASRDTCVASVVSGMTQAQRVGQLFLAGVTTGGPTQRQLNTIHSLHLGGAILMGHTHAGSRAVRAVTDTLRSHAPPAHNAGVGLWVAADQEGGNVQVLHGPGFSEMPTALTQGGWSPGTLRHRASRWGDQLRSAGITLNLAPVLDTVPGSLGDRNKPIGYYDREYGHTPATVRSHGLAFVHGMRSGYVQTTVKHFPGLGRVIGNTDTTPGVTDTVTTRHDPYLAPFAAAISADVPVVMVSLARYSKIDGRRAVFSPTVMRGMLRHDLGFHGVIMSDSMNAAAVQDLSPGARATRFLDMGGDVVLETDLSDVPAMVQAVRHQADIDPGFAAEVTTAAKKVVAAKWRAGMVACPAASDPIALHYAALGGAGSYLGSPVGPERHVNGGRARSYQHGAIYWSADTGAHVVRGAIRGDWAAHGSETGVLGYPITDELSAPDGVGRANNFQGPADDGNASIYWTPDTGAHAILGAIRGKWVSLGWERGPMGYPVTDERGTPDGVGRYNHFQGPNRNGNGSIYWTPATGAHSVQGAIRHKWASLGWERSVLGYPVTDERGTPDGVGRYNHFQGPAGNGNGSIYWTPTTGAHAVYGTIRDTWASLGWEHSRLGYPVSDEYGIPGGRRSDFQHGAITWDRSSGGVRVIHY